MIITLAALTMMSLTHAARTKVIYGDDDRLDIYAATNELHLELARSTAAMIPNSTVRPTDEGTVVISGSTLQQRGMCPTERFADQVTAANCSGFLVGPDLLVTAGHCIRTRSDCSAYKWVFDFNVPDMDAPRARIEVPADSVYSCAQIIQQSLDRSSNDDFALIRLDRAVTDRTPLRVRTEGRVADGTDLVVIGHPTGLPTKIADGAWVRNNSNRVFFTANLDTYGGNSGSAVFDAQTGLVEGILVRGENDYVFDSRQGCRVSNLCPNDGCRGEDVTRITNITALTQIINGSSIADVADFTDEFDTVADLLD
jgi:V8-like Glu-specific endopeptidase